MNSLNKTKQPTALLAWELGDNLGHITSLCQYALRLKAKGWRCVFVLKDTFRAHDQLDEHAFEWLQAPVWMKPIQGLPPPMSYAEVLMQVGFLNRNGLAGVVAAWRNLVLAINPDVVVLDSAPTASLALRDLTIPTVAVGNGFAIPPFVSPWPAFPALTNGKEASLARLVDSERLVLDVINSLATRFNFTPLNMLADLYPLDNTLICSSPELDQYQRQDPIHVNRFVGTVATTDSGEIPAWPIIHGQADVGLEPKRVFAYLSAGYPALPEVLSALKSLPVQTLAYIPGMSVADRIKWDCVNLVIYENPLLISEVTKSCTLAVGHGGGMTNAFLSAGIPVFLLPTQTEQVMLANRVEELGAGLSCKLESRLQIKKMLKKLLEISAFTDRANDFRVRNALGCTDSAADKVVAEIMRRCRQT
jgi:UDP:flavonoid glycosyltransferase YjiC (YdhE family)